MKKRYPSYKPSGIEWISDIPIHWSVKRLKRLAKICNGQDQKDVAVPAGAYPIIGTGGEFGRTNHFLHIGPSVILGRKGTIDKPQYIESGKRFWTVDTAYYTVINPTTSPRYFYYCCLTINFEMYKYGSAVPSMTQEVLNQIPFAIPPFSEQKLLANYLDQKTRHINQTIRKKQQLIELLHEEKTAFINHAVTKGIDAGAPMKPSGVEWLGDVPAHWEKRKLKYIVDKIDQLTTNTEFVIAVENIESHTGRLVFDDTQKNYQGQLYAFEEGDILFNKLRPYLAKVHLAEKDGSMSGELLILRPKTGFNNLFVYYRILSYDFIQEVNSSTEGTK
ncbi:MAG: restriction endonuclease subunit S, partial [Chitinophagaceae bacterium]